MLNRDVMRARTFHVLQSTPASCVAACVCMVRRRLGQDITESALLAEWGSGGPFALQVHAKELREPQYPASVDPDARSSRELLLAALTVGHWIIVTIVPLPHPNRPHAIVLIGLSDDDDTYVYMDPGQPGDDQPVALSGDDLIKQWTGEMIVVDVS